MRPIQNSEPVPGDPYGGDPAGPFALGGVWVLTVAVFGDRVQVVGAVLQVGGPGAE